MYGINANKNKQIMGFILIKFSNLIGFTRYKPNFLEL